MAYEAATQISNTYCEYILKLPGVLNANVVFEDSEITEIHILADTTRTPKQIVRDVQSLFMAQFHREIDHKIVSVAQIDYDVKAKDAPRPSPRFSIDTVTVSKRKDHTEIAVALGLEGKSFEGKQSCMNDQFDIFRGIAVATLAAVVQPSDRIRTYSVLDVRFIELAGDRLAIVCVSLTPNGNKASRYCGTAFTNGDDDVALVKATLDSINRVIGHN